MKKIKEHNSKESTFKLGINEFADLTWEEFKSGYLAEPTPNPEFNIEGELMTDVDPVDWRDCKVVTPVKN